MIALEFEAVEVDYCVECSGVWLDEGELELLFGDHQACADFLSIGSPALSHDEKRHRCPACDATMVKESTEGEPPILLDRCPHGHGLWFDHGELDEALSRAEKSGARGPVDNLLLGMFARNAPEAKPIAEKTSDETEPPCGN